MKKTKICLILIVVIATILRIYQLGKTPIALEWDEVAIGYDAYSILNTGKDQFGQLLPLTFRSLDDYKPPLYEYLTIPTVALFGLNSFSVRLPSAFFGILTVIATYWLALTIFSEVPKMKPFASLLALSSAFLLSVSPWHLQFSRAAFEVNISVFITVVAVTLFVQGLKKPKYFLFSALFFGLDLFSYHSTRVVAPLLMISLFILFNKQLPQRKYLVSFFLILAVFILGFLPILTSKNAQIRFQATNIFNPGARYLDEKDLEKAFLEERLKDKVAGYDLAGRIFHNQRLIYTDYETLKKAAGKYLSHFNFEYLFIKGDAPLHHAPGFGLLYLWELPFLLIGLFYIFKSRSRYTLILLIWMLIAPIPAAVTRETPHAVRTELFLPTFQIITAFGLVTLTRMFMKESRWVSGLVVGLIVFIAAISQSFYLHQYYVHTNFELSQNWKYGRKEVAEYTESVKNNYDKIIVSLNVDMPYIFWLFYTKYSPNKYQEEGGTVSGGFAEERNHFDKYEFRHFNYAESSQTPRLLFVGMSQDFPPDAKIIRSVNYLDGTNALKIAENK